MTTFAKAFQPNYADIVEKIDVTHGLLPKLFSSKVLERYHISEIQEISTEHAKADRLLQLLERRNDDLVPKFCKALEDDGQKHVVGLLSLTPSNAVADEMPRSNQLPRTLPDGRCERCKQRHSPAFQWKFGCFIGSRLSALVKQLDIGGGFFTELADKRIFATDWDIAEITCEKNDYDRKVKLWDKLKRCDDAKVDAFIEILENTNNTQIAQHMRDYFGYGPRPIEREPAAGDAHPLEVSQQPRRRHVNEDGEPLSKPAVANASDTTRTSSTNSRRTCCVVVTVSIVAFGLVGLVVIGYDSGSSLLPAANPISVKSGDKPATKTGKASTTSASFEEMFRGRRSQLSNKISVSADLWTRLLDKKLLTRWQVEDCKKKHTDVEKIDCMLEHLEKRDSKLVPEFCDLLVEIDQEYIRQDLLGGYCPV